jgi:hypothetical protein
MKRQPDVRRARREPATPAVATGFAVALGTTVVVVAAFAAELVPAPASGLRLGLMAVALAACAVVTANLRAAALVMVIGYLVFDGFLANRMGELTWTGAPDVRRLCVLAAGTGVGLVAGAARRWLWRQRRFAPLEAWANGESAGGRASGVTDTSVIFR